MVYDVGSGDAALQTIYMYTSGRIFLPVTPLFYFFLFCFFFSSRRRHTRLVSDWNSDVCSSDLNPKRVTNDPMEAHVIGFAMWVKAVEKVKSTDPDKVIDALPGIEAPNLTGGTSKMLPNHHITKPVYIGEVRGDGQFDVVWKTPSLVPGEAWSRYLPGSKDLEADWVKLKCGNYNTVTKKCGGA